MAGIHTVCACFKSLARTLTHIVDDIVHGERCLHYALDTLINNYELIVKLHVHIREHGSVSLCRDGQKTKWRLQCKY